MRVVLILVTLVTVSAITVPPIWPQSVLRTTPKPKRVTYRQRLNRNTQYPKIRATPRPNHQTTQQSDWIPLHPPGFPQGAHANPNIRFGPVRTRLNQAPKYNPGPDHYISSSPELLSEETPVKSTYNSPISPHEVPKDIPTRPIYPGEGLWAKPGLKHKPHISPHQFSTPAPIKERPEGYDIFERGEDRFKTAQEKYKANSEKFKNQHLDIFDSFEEPASTKAPKKSEIKKVPSSQSFEEDDFVPQKLYSQVRMTESRKHLPRSEEEDDRLREVIKDSKIQTVYTEEGYEDSAYDHAGKEKKAESQEGHVKKETDEEVAKVKGSSQKGNRYGQKRGQTRGRSKVRGAKDHSQFSKFKNHDTSENYEDARKKVEEELDSELGESKTPELQTAKPQTARPSHSSNLHQSKQKIEIKSTMKNGDDINMEIHTEVKFINGSDKRKHKFVKIIPSYQRVVEPEDQSSESYEETHEGAEGFKDHRRTKRSTRKLPKYHGKGPTYYWKKKKTTTKTTIFHGAPVKTSIKIRARRSLEDGEVVPKVPSIPRAPPPKLKKAPPRTDTKFPFYKLDPSVLHESSPLRYAEHPDNVPLKTADPLAFYNSRSKVHCADIPDDVDPIPQRIKGLKTNDDVKENDGSDKTGPRLEGLGDKIDCLKRKYFGKDPLDSPIFKEDAVEIPVPKVFKKGPQKRASKREAKALLPIVVQEEETNTTTNPVMNQGHAVLRPPFTLAELASKLLKNKTHPSSIYDQINLLSVEEPQGPKFLIHYENEKSAENSIQNESTQNDSTQNDSIQNESTQNDSIQNDQNLEDKVANISLINQELSSSIEDYEDEPEEPANLQEEEEEYDYDLTPLDQTSLKTDQEESKGEPEAPVPVQEALRDYRYFSQLVPQFKPGMKDSFKGQLDFSTTIFDISKYLPQIKKPNHKSVTSEVQYKEAIKPSEQLNVYSDVLRAINISNQEDQGQEPLQPITVKLQIANRTKLRLPKTPKRKLRIKPTTRSPIVDLLTKPDSTAASTHVMNQTSPQIFPTEQPTAQKKLPDKIKAMISTYANPLLIKIPEESSEISGLAPPPTSDTKYRTLPLSQTSQKPLNLRQLRQNVNYFYVSGMRPPKKIFMSYDDFLNNYKIKRSKRSLRRSPRTRRSSRIRRNPQRKPIMYTEIVRSRNPVRIDPDDEEEEDEDVAPRRKTYNFKAQQRTTTTEEPEEEYVDEIIEEPPRPVEKPVKVIERPVVLERPTGTAPYIKLIEQLHEYRFVNNITTTLPEYATTTANPRKTTSTTPKIQTAESVNKGVPAFLQVIEGLHKANPTTTTEEPEEEEELGPVQNSNPYLASPLRGEAPQDNIDEDPEAHVRNLRNKLRLNVDTSKYKTIERPVLRHNLSSRYNSEEEKLPLERIFTTKMPAVFTTTIRNEEKELVLQREHAPQLEDTPDETTTVGFRTRGTRRKVRPRTRPSTTTTAPETTTRLVVRRRRPQKPSTETPTTTSPTPNPRRRMRLKLEPQGSIKSYVSEVPPNHKREYVPVTEINRSSNQLQTLQTSNDINKSTWKKLFDRIALLTPLPEEPPEEFQEESPEASAKTNDKKEEVEVFSELQSPIMRHGGNYRHNDPISQKSQIRNRFALKRRPFLTRTTEATTTTEVSLDDEPFEEEAETRTAKPKFIKDPNKRMYFYAKL